MTEEPGLSRPDSLAGRMQRAVLDVLRRHEANGELPTNNRFVFYELEGLGVVRKSAQGESHRGNSNDPREQEVIDASMRLRVLGIVPWWWIDDETRQLHDLDSAPTVAQYVRDSVDVARINPWHPDPAPLILVESRSLGGPLRPTAERYVCPLAATNGQVGGFLRTEIAPLLGDDLDNRRVLYLGDHDLQGDQIEDNTRRVLEQVTLRSIDWQRIAITAEQVAEHDLEPVWKVDHRYRPAREHAAVETEALGQGRVLALVRAALDELLPEPIDDVLERERQQREEVAELLDSLDDDDEGGTSP